MWIHLLKPELNFNEPWIFKRCSERNFASDKETPRNVSIDSLLLLVGLLYHEDCKSRRY